MPNFVRAPGGGLCPPHPHLQSAASAASGGTHLSYVSLQCLVFSYIFPNIFIYFLIISYMFLYIYYIFQYFPIFSFTFPIDSYIFLLFPINPVKGLLWYLAFETLLVLKQLYHYHNFVSYDVPGSSPSFIWTPFVTTNWNNTMPPCYTY